MATLSVRIPNSVHNAIKTLAKEDDISINQFIASAVTEKLTAMETADYIESRAARDSEEKYRSVLKKVPHVAPREDDIIRS